MIVIVRLIAYPKETTQEEERGGVCEVQEWLRHPLLPLPRIDATPSTESLNFHLPPFSHFLIPSRRQGYWWPATPAISESKGSQLLATELDRDPNKHCTCKHCSVYTRMQIEFITRAAPRWLGKIVSSIHRLARVLIFERQLNFQRLWHISLLLPGLYHCDSGLLFAVMC